MQDLQTVLPRRAFVSERIGSAILNSFVGCLPIVIPVFMTHEGAVSPNWKSNDIAIIFLAVGLAMLQYLFSHFLRGSPGYICAGLRVKDQETGGAPTFKATAIRSAPYIVAAIPMIFLPCYGADAPIVKVTLGILYVAAGGFLSLNGVFLFLDGERSLLDKMSGTEVMKTYKMTATFR